MKCIGEQVFSRRVHDPKLLVFLVKLIAAVSHIIMSVTLFGQQITSWDDISMLMDIRASYQYYS